MARVSTTTARFNPFTMEELYAPVLRATEKHLEQQEKYDELANQAEVWKYRIDPESTQALEAYNTFMNNMNAMVDDLNANGILSPSARDNFSALRRSNPIPMFEEAWKAREADRLMRESKGEDAAWETPLGNFDAYLTNKVNNNYISKSSVKKAGADAGIAIAKSIVSNPEYRKILGNQYFEKIEKEGIPRNILLAAQSNDLNYLNTDSNGNVDPREMELYKTVRGAYENDANSFGYNNWGNANTVGQLDSSYWSGMLKGLESTKFSEVTNRGYIDPIRGEEHSWKREDRAREQQSRDRLDRLARGQGTPEDKWWARSNGIDPDSGARIKPSGSSSSSSSSGSGGKASDHIHNYSPRIIRKSGEVVTDSASLKNLKKAETDENKIGYQHRLFTDLTYDQQRQILSNMGYTKEQQDAMFVPIKRDKPNTLREAMGSDPIADYKFVGDLDLSPDYLNHWLDIQVNDDTGDMYSVGKSWQTTSPTGQTLEELEDNLYEVNPIIVQQAVAADSTRMSRIKEGF